MSLILKLFKAATAPTPPTQRLSVVSNRYEPPNISTSATVATVQSAIRAAEAGDTRLLFALYRDITIGGSHIQAELQKRKFAILAQPHEILPEDKKNADDVAAATAVTQMIGDCENWIVGLGHILDSVLWPVSAVEKIYKPAEAGGSMERGAGSMEPGAGNRQRSNPLNLQYTLKTLEPVNPTLFCFWRNYEIEAPPPEQWEPDLRFYFNEPNGRIDYSTVKAYYADRNRHLIHRGHLLTGIRDNWGGPMRSCVFWWLLASLGRDWFGRFMERYGSPFPVVRTDITNADALAFLKEALSLSLKIGGLIVGEETMVELKESMVAGGADGYEKFLNVCNREISKVIVGQTTSSEPQHNTLGTGNARLAGDVRDDIKAFDQISLGHTLRRQLFEPFLEINGLTGRAPKIVWGGLDPQEAQQLAQELWNLAQAGLEPTDDALPGLSERVGFALQRRAVAQGAGSAEQGAGNQNPNGRFAAPFRSMLLSSALPAIAHPSDAVATAKAAALAQAFRGSLAPVRQIILHSASPADAQKQLAAFYVDWKPARVNAVLEEALQLCAAAGAADGLPAPGSPLLASGSVLLAPGSPLLAPSSPIPATRMGLDGL